MGQKRWVCAPFIRNFSHNVSCLNHSRLLLLISLVFYILLPFSPFSHYFCLFIIINLRSESSSIDSEDKEKPNFQTSGLLNKGKNSVRGVEAKYVEAPDGEKPKLKWRLYPFKGEKALGNYFSFSSYFDFFLFFIYFAIYSFFLSSFKVFCINISYSFH